MKVLIINGSPRKELIYSACLEAADSLREQGIDSEIVSIGTKPIRGCTACYKCRTEKLNRCVFNDDIVNEVIDKLVAADGVMVGSPVYYGGINGALKCLLDRMFYSAGHLFTYKPAAGFSGARRAGTTPTIEQINRFFMLYHMPIVTSCYWPMVHGNKGEQMQEDAEGIYTMRTLASNMAWLLQCLEAAKTQGIATPNPDPRPMTNFVR